MTAPDLQDISWRKNLASMWLVRVFSGMGINFMYPFLPLFVRDLGIEDPGRAALWAGAAIGVSGIPMFICGPIWGVLGDRFGRKRNALRAIFATAAVLSLMGLSTKVYHLVVLRFIYGVVTGVDATSNALIASTTPREQIPFSIGALYSSSSIGNTLGPILGALVAETLGFRAAFFTAAGLLAFGGLLVALLARENFQPAPAGTPLFPHNAFRSLWKLISSRRVFPVMIVLFIVHLVPPMMFVALPLLLEQLKIRSVVGATGIAFALIGLMAALASYGSGWLANRVGMLRIIIAASIGAGLAYLPLLLLNTFPSILLTLAFIGLFQGAILTTSTTLVGMAVPTAQLGAAFGSIQSVTLSGFTTGPLIAGIVVSTLNIRFVFLAQSIGILSLAILVGNVVRRYY
jgi:DHA1 family multidrug resistance protein-like MFS transporter